MIKVKNHRRKLQPYNPNQGFIGTVKVDVANYIFSSRRKRAPYLHSKALVKNLLSREVSIHLKESRSLTRFIRKRDLTFQKSDAAGNYKIFTVPCTTTIVPLQKSVFNTIEKAAQSLVVSLRCVIQDIYGSKSVKDSGFVKSLPIEIRQIFIDAIVESPNYFAQLHHPSMKKYPFFDNVGLDLVLIEDYLEQSKNFDDLLKAKKMDKLPELPFRILELNAGAPSGASNNMNVLEGHYEQNPEVLDSLGRLMPNDHFQVLAETYKSLGEDWTGVKDGIQVILPPGGMNGAAPEIHNLAAYSGLVYADPVQLFQDDKGFIRLRTINGSNPVVTAIYSRINADSALFDMDKGIILRDPDTNEPIYLRDSLKLGEEGEAPLVLDVHGNPIPLQSDYAVPGLLEAILNKKIYMGGLNRILDNKIILAALTTHAPKYFSSKLKELGILNNGPKIIPPDTLPPKMSSVEEIERNPEEWVVKAPNLSGGSGIYIMKTLSTESKKEVLEMIRAKPAHFAYQKLVKIARIPVAMKDKKDGIRFANLAADIRLWVFFGGGAKALPKMTHNALVRYAPEEKGPMSSIVNTSKGGGYAPFVVVDDVNSSESVTAAEFIKTKSPVPLQTHLPMFVAAQLIQVSRLATEIYNHLKNGTADSYIMLGLALSLKTQCREVLSFMNPRSIEPVYRIIDILESKQASIAIAAYFERINLNQLNLVSCVEKLETAGKLPRGFRERMDELLVLDMDIVYQNYGDENRKHDRKILKDLRTMALEKAGDNKVLLKQYSQLLSILRSSIEASFPREQILGKSALNLMKMIELFMSIVRDRLQNSEKAIEFARLFSIETVHPEMKFETFGLSDASLNKKSSFLTASQKEFATGVLLTETDYIPENIKEARNEWMKIEAEVKKLPADKRQAMLAKKRTAHFEKFPFLDRMNRIMGQTKGVGVKDILDLLPAMPYAKYNLEQFAKKQGLALEDIFTNELTPNKISILTTKQIGENHLSAQDHAGECFAKKRKSHGLFSDSDIFIWVRKELDPLTQIYTAGHEVIHFHQIEETTKMEAKALSDGAIAQAYFLNFYGNFLGVSAASLEGLSVDISVERQPLYGFADRIVPYFFSKLITEIRTGINTSRDAYETVLNKYGSIFGYMMPSSNQVKVKALQEVVPALENAKNIRFAKELGLEISWDEVRSALPSANAAQLKTYGPKILKAIKKAKPDYEALMAIGNHQFYGVSFSRKEDLSRSITLRPILSTISLGNSYNQTQQQQQQ
ncbi:MAG TPA: circularly permuted type 2 ATP-grasp protein [Bacteriovoracaceae bacterium]|nr:circularly permuted type 2 ATP-grasp protein [Bacteriovoracaceae bacterium]